MLTRVTDRVGCFGYVRCPPDSKIKYSVFYKHMCTYVHVLYYVLFYWYLLCSRKANFYVTHRQ